MQLIKSRGMIVFITEWPIYFIWNQPYSPFLTKVCELADLCQERGIWLISDEVYWSLCYENDHASAFNQLHTRENVIVLNSLSKSHAMTGWRIGWIIAPEEIIEAMLFLSQAWDKNNIASMISSGAIIQPMRHPVIAWDLDKLFKTITFSLVCNWLKAEAWSFS